MSSVATRSSQWLAGLVTGCDGLVHPAVAAEKRRVHGRMISVLLTLPLLMAAWAAQILPQHLATAGVLAALCAILAQGWVAAAFVSATGRDGIAGPLSLAVSSGVAGLLIAASGGLSSPLVFLLVAFLFEPWWVRRENVVLQSGGFAAIVAFVLGGTLRLPADVVVTVSAWHWLLPAAYAASLLARLHPMLGTAGRETPDGMDPLLDRLSDSAVLRFSENGDLVDIDERARAMFNLPPELLLGNGLFDRIHVADRVPYLCVIAEVRSGADVGCVNIRVRLPRDNGTGPGSYRLFLLKFAAAGNGMFAAIIRPNDEVAALREELDRAMNGMEAGAILKNRFLATISHELRTPLNSIIGFSDVLLSEMFGGFGDPKQKEYVGLVRESGAHLLSVVNSLLDMSKLESGAYSIQPEPFRFAEAVESSRNMLVPQAEAKNIAMSINVAPSVGEIRADRRAVKQILINLVSNAVKFTPEGGSVSIEAKRLGSRLHFSVSDTGIGISEGDIGRVGEPFMQVSNDYTRRFEGTGLGLSLVKGLVALHEGTMTIESSPGEGTMVTITLPVSGPDREGETDDGGSKVLRRTKFGRTSDGALRKTA